MKRSFIVFVCMNFCFVLPSEYDDMRQQRIVIVQGILRGEQLDNNARQHQAFQRLTGPLFDAWSQQLRQEQEQRQQPWLQLLEKKRVRQALLKKGIELENVTYISNPISRGDKKVIHVEVKECQKMEEVCFKEHSRRGDKYKQPEYAQYTQAHQRTNNRKTSVQLNNKSSKRNY